MKAKARKAIEQTNEREESKRRLIQLFQQAKKTTNATRRSRLIDEMVTELYKATR